MARNDLALVWLFQNVMSDDADEIKIVKVVQGSKSMPPLNEPSKAMTQQSSSQTEHQKQHDKVKVEANETRRALRLTKVSAVDITEHAARILG